jgi:hypothetical protein
MVFYVYFHKYILIRAYFLIMQKTVGPDGQGAGTPFNYTDQIYVL